MTEQLGWRSVEELRAGMSNDEFIRWNIYFARRAQDRELAEKQAQAQVHRARR